MKAITKYIAVDGSEWNTPGQAVERDNLVRDVAAAMAPLGPRYEAEGCDYANGHGFVRHDPEDVRRVRAALAELTRKPLAWWLEERAKAGHEIDLATLYPSVVGRLLDREDPLSDAWGRLCCIDARGREWGQPYYAVYPEQGEAIELERPGVAR